MESREAVSIINIRNDMQSRLDAASVKSFRFKITLLVQSLKIARATTFSCKVQWKRHQAKAETKTVLHKDHQSVFNESLVLEFNIQQDQVSKLYLPKNTDLLPVIITDNGLKCGGVARFDISEALNSSLTKTEKELPLSKCPDPKGTIKITLTYENLGPVISQNDESVLQVSPDALQTPKTPRSPTFGPCSQEQKLTFSSTPEPKQLQDLTNTNQSEVTRLNKVIESLERRLIDSRNKEEQLKAQNQKLLSQILVLQKSLDKKSLQLIEKSRQLATAKAHNDFCNKSTKKLVEKDEEIAKLVEKMNDYEKRLSQKQISIGKIEHFQLDSSDLARAKTDRNSATTNGSQGIIKQLQQQKFDLQHQLAASNIKIANIFNIAYETGGPQLLDIIQSCCIE